MKIEHFYLKCLAHGSYLITDSGKAVVIDPQRDIAQYIQLAKDLGVSITHVINTHHHADFVSGHLELAQKTGAKIYLGSKANANFDHVPLHDGDKLEIGNIQLQILETPGHTPESISIFAKDLSNPSESPALFTGDTLFIGEVGRPDLLEGVMQPKDLASMLYDSLHNKIMTLPDETIVYPAHGAGSQCGKNISDNLNSTLGEQKQTNYALRIPSKEEFIETVLDGMPTPPAYFKYNAKLNKTGPASTDALVSKIKALSADEFSQIANDKSIVIIDSRSADEFWEAYIPNSVNIPLEGQFASWVGTVIPFESKILLISAYGKEQETITRLLRTGYDFIQGYLDGGIETWKNAGKKVNHKDRINVSDLDSFSGKMLDVRKPIETKNGKINSSALEIPLQEFPSKDLNLPNEQMLIYCGSGYRSSIAMSLLLRKNPHLNLVDLRGGYNAWFSSRKLASV